MVSLLEPLLQPWIAYSWLFVTLEKEILFD